MGLIDAVEAHYVTAGALDRLVLERFQIALIGPDPGDGGTATIDGVTFDAPAGIPLLVAGEEAGSRSPPAAGWASATAASAPSRRGRHVIFVPAISSPNRQRRADVRFGGCRRSPIDA